MSGKLQKQSRNANMRANGIEPPLSDFASLRKLARFIRRTPAVIKAVKEPEKYLHSFARRNSL